MVSSISFFLSLPSFSLSLSLSSSSSLPTTARRLDHSLSSVSLLFPFSFLFLFPFFFLHLFRQTHCLSSLAAQPIVPPPHLDDSSTCPPSVLERLEVAGSEIYGPKDLSPAVVLARLVPHRKETNNKLDLVKLLLQGGYISAGSPSFASGLLFRRLCPVPAVVLSWPLLVVSCLDLIGGLIVFDLLFLGLDEARDLQNVTSLFSFLYIFVLLRGCAARLVGL